ncbi:unnamed protein product [Rotaria sordida]|uniref:UNC93-like protein MFSD11 n=1 Tax=Rotaria sordida TaxID=392033 RepID=A0A819AGG6_9BILA|nr:unnamed protein product [Rotaria sordida]CAF0921894.1 unnamed protein product [Rotaria sordida]CAF0927012.1 unnamed protein product [Rotaria sordida]CAF1089585.1 unnamed protein product [Rotaria sordida]CAF3777268.1 unnamed protein product [Rotaria sordida]
MDNRLMNVILLGSAFMVLFTAFQATGMISQSVLEGVKNDTTHGNRFHGSGYTSMAILYSCFALTNIFAPAIVSIFRPAVAMFLGGTTYFLYVLSFIYPMTWSYYIVSVLIGIGAAILWTAQGVYLANNSNDSTISRNSGIFWALFQVSLLAGNIYVYIALKTEMIDSATRIPLFIVFSIVSAIGLVLFVFIIWRSYVEKNRDTLIHTVEERRNTLVDIVQTLKIAVRLLKTRNMLLLLLPFAYSGFSTTFFQGVYGTCIGHYVKYGDTRKRLIGLHGILVGCGEILGGGLFGFITKPKTSSQRALMILVGFILQIIYYYSVFVNFPSNAPSQETIAKPYFDYSSKTSQVIAFISSFIVGLGDSSLNTQLMNVLATRYKQCTASAFAIFKLVQSLMAAVAFFYAGSLQLEWQLLIVVIFLFFGTLAFFKVLFDESENEFTATSVTVTLQDNEHDSYQNYSSSIA